MLLSAWMTNHKTELLLWHLNQGGCGRFYFGRFCLIFIPPESPFFTYLVLWSIHVWTWCISGPFFGSVHATSTYIPSKLCFLKMKIKAPQFDWCCFWSGCTWDLELFFVAWLNCYNPIIGKADYAYLCIWFILIYVYIEKNQSIPLSFYLNCFIRRLPFSSLHLSLLYCQLLLLFALKAFICMFL